MSALVASRSCPGSRLWPRWRNAAIVAGCIGVVAGGSLADAQTFTGSMGVRRMIMPGASAPVPQEPSATGALASPVEVESPVEPVPVARERLVRLSAGRGGWRIDGESGELDWFVYGTPSEVAAAAQFRLVYRTDISVLPDVSRVTILINGTPIGMTGGEAAARPRSVVFDVPAGLLKPGFNAVTMRSDQRHRVDCSFPATYELWTEIDPARSGLILQGAAPSIASVADLPALPVRPDGAFAIRVVVTGKLRPVDLARTLEAASAIAVASRTLHPVVDFGPLSAEASVNLLVGRDDDLDAFRSRLASGDKLAPGLTFSPAVTDRAATLVVSGPSDPDVDAAVAAIGRPSTPAGTSLGRRIAELPFGPRTEGGETLPLSTFGIGHAPFTGRRLALELPLVLPADFLPADYGQIVLKLVGETGATLGPRSEILVRVNDRDAASWPMKVERTGSFEQPFGLQLSLFRPGPNRIEITALLPGSEPDGACPAANGATPNARFTISDASSLIVPPLARITRRPELASVTTGEAPVGEIRRRLQIVAPQPDRDSLGAAATVAARLATSIGRAPEMTFSRKANSGFGGDILLVAPAQTLDQGAMAATGLDGEATRRAWQPRVEQVTRARSDPLTTGSSGDPNRGGPSACAGKAMRPGESAPFVATPASLDPAIVRADVPSIPPGWLDGVKAGSQEMARRAADALFWPLDRVGALIHATSSSFGPRSDEIALLVQGQTETGERLFVLTAPDATDLKAAAECLVSPQRWSNLAGRAVAMSAADGALRTIAAATVAYSWPQHFGFGNTRLIAAGLLSLNPAVFVALALALAGVMTLSTTILVRNLGRRQS